MEVGIEMSELNRVEGRANACPASCRLDVLSKCVLVAATPS